MSGASQQNKKFGNALRNKVTEPANWYGVRFCGDEAVWIRRLAAWVVRPKDPRLVGLPVVSVDFVKSVNLRNCEARSSVLSRATRESLRAEATLVAVSESVARASTDSRAGSWVIDDAVDEL